MFKDDFVDWIQTCDPDACTAFQDDSTLLTNLEFAEDQWNDHRDSDPSSSSDDEVNTPDPTNTLASSVTAKPDPWTRPAAYKLEGNVLMDYGSSVPTPVGRIYGPLQSGSMRCICLLKGHGTAKNPCYFWSTTRSKRNPDLFRTAAMWWLHEGQKEGMNWGKHRTLADTTKRILHDHLGQ